MYGLSKQQEPNTDDQPLLDLNALNNDDLLTVREVAKYLRVDDTTVRRWIKLNVFDAVVLPHRASRQAYRVRVSTLRKILETPAS